MAYTHAQSPFHSLASHPTSHPTSAAQTQQAAAAPENVYPGGYYVNGVYVVPVTQSPQQTYYIYGVDIPCNPYNNNTAGSNNVTFPNCQDVTTRKVPVNTTNAPVVIGAVAATTVVPALAPDVTSSLVIISVSVLISMFSQLFSKK